METKYYLTFLLPILAILSSLTCQQYPSAFVPIPHVSQPQVLSTVEYYAYSAKIDHVPASYKQKTFDLQRMPSLTNSLADHPEDNPFDPIASYDLNRKPRMTTVETEDDAYRYSKPYKLLYREPYDQPKYSKPYDQLYNQDYSQPYYGAAEDNFISSSPSSTDCALILRRTFVKKSAGRTPAPKYADLFKQPFNK
jgi:hypothetical protein